MHPIIFDILEVALFLAAAQGMISLCFRVGITYYSTAFKHLGSLSNPHAYMVPRRMLLTSLHNGKEGSTSD